EPGGMGKPVPDVGVPDDGGDGKIDIYLVEPLAPCRQRGELCVPLGSAAAIAQRDQPLNCAVNGFPARGCSAYMILSRVRMDDAAFASDFVHEFFHTLEFAHNGQTVTHWYLEASAVWAEFHYERAAAKTGAYAHFKAYQKEDRSLLFWDPDRLFQYRAWAWPLFQETESSASSVFQAWQAA